MKKSAFTLIELLVVIAIIAILAGIALPVFQKAQERGRATNDAANLRQVGLGVQSYLLDNDDQISQLAGATVTTVWPIVLHDKYVPTWKVFQSPFDKRAPSEKAPGVPVSYGINKNVANALPAPAAGGPSYNGNAAQFVSASELVLMAPHMTAKKEVEFTDKSEDNVLLETPTPGGNKMGTHSSRGQINVLFADAHVTSMGWKEFASSGDEEGKRRWFPLGL